MNGAGPSDDEKALVRAIQDSRYLGAAPNDMFSDFLGNGHLNVQVVGAYEWRRANYVEVFHLSLLLHVFTSFTCS